MTMPKQPRYIHLNSVPFGVCSRKDTKADQEQEVTNQTTIIRTALTSHIENVNCPVCLENAK